MLRPADNDWTCCTNPDQLRALSVAGYEVRNSIANVSTVHEAAHVPLRLLVNDGVGHVLAMASQEMVRYGFEDRGAVGFLLPATPPWVHDGRQSETSNVLLPQAIPDYVYDPTGHPLERPILDVEGWSIFGLTSE